MTASKMLGEWATAMRYVVKENESLRAALEGLK